jgi:phosphomevalonate kinase
MFSLSEQKIYNFLINVIITKQVMHVLNQFSKTKNKCPPKLFLNSFQYDIYETESKLLIPALNSESFCLSFPSTGITGVCHY